MHIITGGAGFIGSNIANALIKNKEDIVICDYIDHAEKKINIEGIDKKLIIRPDKLFKYIKINHKKINSIIHMGAISSTAEKNLELLLNNNFFFSQKLFKLCNKHRIKFIYASSAATYGRGENGFNDENSLLQMSKLTPINLYGLSKYLFDITLLSELQSGIECSSEPVGLKFFNVYGINEMHKGFMMSPIPKFYEQIKKENKLKLFKSHRKDIEDGMQSRDFIYVEDCVSIVLWFLKNPRKTGIFNVGTGQSESFNKLASIIFKKLKIKINIKYINTPISIRSGYQYITKANLSSLRKIGYTKTFTSLKDGVEKYIDYLEKKH